MCALIKKRKKLDQKSGRKEEGVAEEAVVHTGPIPWEGLTSGEFLQSLVLNTDDITRFA